MQLRDALDDYKRYRHASKVFPGEDRSTTGRFSGRDGRLVHVHPDGSLRDFGYPSPTSPAWNGRVSASESTATSPGSTRA